MRSMAFLLSLLAGGMTAAPLYNSELIFPLEKWHNHSSSIIQMPNGGLLVCWFHGSGERTADDVRINAARWNNKNNQWSAPFTLADTPGFPETNPTLFIDSKQRLFFLWPVIIAHQWETALMKISNLDGLSAGFRTAEVGAPGQHSADTEEYCG